MAEKDLRKLIQDQDKDTVVQNSVKNTLNKKLNKMHPTERMAVAGQAVDEEITIARDTGQIDDQTALATREATQNPKKYDKEIKKGGVKGKFLEALTYFAPQAIGMAIGGAIGGADGAVAGGDKAQSLAQGFRTESRAQEKHDADMGQQDITNELKRRDQELRDRKLDAGDTAANKFKAKDFLYRKSDGALLSFKESDGKVYDSAGNVVEAGEYVNTSVNRDINQGKRVDIAELNSLTSRENLGQRKIGTELKLDKFEEDKKNKDELSDSQVARITQLDAGTKALDNIMDEAGNAAGKFGPMKSRVESLKSKFGIADPQFLKLQQSTRVNLTSVVKEASGTAASDKERANIMAYLPNENDSFEQLAVKADGFKKYLKDKRKIELKNMKKFQGKNIDGMLDIKPEQKSLEQKRSRLQELRAKRAAAKGSR